MKKLLFIVLIILLAAATSAITYLAFDTRFADITIDYFAFLAGLFLMIEGFYSLALSGENLYRPKQLMRLVRVIIGTAVFTIHVLQFMRI